MTKLYTDEDLKAAVDAYFTPGLAEDVARAILEAVAPKIAARAFAAGFTEALKGSHVPADPDEAAEVAREWIEGRA